MNSSGQSPDRPRSPRALRRRAEAPPSHPPANPAAQDSAILAQRAAELARPLPKIAGLPTGDAYIVVVIGGQRLGFPSRHAQEVVSVPEVTPLAGLPPHVLGLANVRSRVLPVFSLTPLFRLPPSTDAGTKLLLLTTDRGDFAVPIEQLEGIRAIPPSSRLQTLSGAPEALLQGVLADGLLLVDVPAVADELALPDQVNFPSPSTSP